MKEKEIMSILSIQVRSDGFSFYAHSSQKRETLRHHSFRTINKDPDVLLGNFKKAFEKNIFLKNHYEKIQVIHVNPWASIVPNTYFDPKFCAEYLSKNIVVFKEDFIAFDTCKNTKKSVVYLPFVNVNNYLLQYYDSFSYFHESFLLIDCLTKLRTTTPTFFMSVFRGLYYLVLIDNSQLKFYNSFEFEDEKEVLYYLKFAVMQQDEKYQNAPVLIMGNLKENNQLLKTLQQYIPNIKKWQPTDNHFIAPNITLSYTEHLS